MHPAPSVIAFSTLSGAGFGLFFWLGLASAPPEGGAAFRWFALAYALAVSGLLSATLHLKNPRNAWKSYREWRSSWLSREMWAALATLAVVGAYAMGLIVGVHLAPLGWLGAALAMLTVLTTAMIYTQLRTVPRWNQWVTPLMFLAYSVAGGALILRLDGAWALLALALIANAAHWLLGDRKTLASTSSTATGLEGDVRLFERPHTGENYVTREMVFRVARKHVARLRLIGATLSVLVPAVVLLASPGPIVTALIVAIHLAGVAITRWVFFAEAEHVVGLYYGMKTAA